MARRGTSLVELLVALLLLQLVGTAALATAFLATRLATRAQRGLATDRARRETLHAIVAAPACREAVPPTTLSLTLPATPERPALPIRLRCGGTSLLELLVALVLLGLVGALAVTILRGASRPLGRLAALAEAGRTVDALALLAAHEAAAPTGLRAAAADQETLDLDRHVGDGPPCAADGPVLTLPRAGWRGVRLPEAERDAVAVRDSTGEWHHAHLAGVLPGSCPDGAAALQLSLDRPVAAGWIVVLEPTRIRAYAGSGGRWLGMVGVGSPAPIQPFAGPLDGGGLHLTAAAGGLVATLAPTGVSPTTLRLATSQP